MKFNGIEITDLVSNTPSIRDFFEDPEEGMAWFWFEYKEGYLWFLEWCQETDQRYFPLPLMRAVVVFDLS